MKGLNFTMAKELQTGLNIIINQKVGAKNTPIYPLTKSTNVYDANGRNIDEIVATLALKEHGNHVPELESADNLRFLRNDNTWATIQSATLEKAGVVKLSNATNVADDTVAATAGAVKKVQDAVTALTTAADGTYVKKTQLGAKTAGDVTGVATLDENGFVPATQLPSYVDDVVEVKMGADLATATLADNSPVTPETGKIYVDAVGDSASEKTYRWSGSKFVVISETLALGETSSTAFDGARGKVAYDHSQSAHARVDATLTEASEKNGYVKINGAETLVYTHPQAEGQAATNPHGTTATDVGLGNVENLNGTNLVNKYVTDTVIKDKLGYTPQNAATLASASQNGVMSAAYAAKLDNVLEAKVSADEPTFTGEGLWFQIVE